MHMSDQRDNEDGEEAPFKMAVLKFGFGTLVSATKDIPIL